MSSEFSSLQRGAFCLERGAVVFDHISDGLERLNISRSFLDHLVIEYETGLELHPRVLLKEGKIHLKLPLLYLLEKGDMVDLTEALRNRVITKEERTKLSVFFDCIADPAMSLKVKRFVLFHELSHVLLNHLSKPPFNNGESQVREREAGLNAVRISPNDLEGAIFLMETMSQYFPNQEATTHPSFVTRAQYLSVLRPPIDEHKSPA